MATKRSPHMKGNKAVISLTIDPDQATALGNVADERRTSVAAIAREAIDLFLRVNRPSAPMPATDNRTSEAA